MAKYIRGSSVSYKQDVSSHMHITKLWDIFSTFLSDTNTSASYTCLEVTRILFGVYIINTHSGHCSVAVPHNEL